MKNFLFIVGLLMVSCSAPKNVIVSKSGNDLIVYKIKKAIPNIEFETKRYTDPIYHRVKLSKNIVEETKKYVKYSFGLTPNTNSLNNSEYYRTKPSEVFEWNCSDDHAKRKSDGRKIVASSSEYPIKEKQYFKDPLEPNVKKYRLVPFDGLLKSYPVKEDVYSYNSYMRKAFSETKKITIRIEDPESLTPIPDVLVDFGRMYMNDPKKLVLNNVSESQKESIRAEAVKLKTYEYTDFDDDIERKERTNSFVLVYAELSEYSLKSLRRDGFNVIDFDETYRTGFTGEIVLYTYADYDGEIPISIQFRKAGYKPLRIEETLAFEVCSGSSEKEIIVNLPKLETRISNKEVSATYKINN